MGTLRILCRLWLVGIPMFTAALGASGAAESRDPVDASTAAIARTEARRILKLLIAGDSAVLNDLTASDRNDVKAIESMLSTAREVEMVQLAARVHIGADAAKTIDRGWVDACSKLHEMTGSMKVRGSGTTWRLVGPSENPDFEDEDGPTIHLVKNGDYWKLDSQRLLHVDGNKTRPVFETSQAEAYRRTQARIRSGELKTAQSLAMALAAERVRCINEGNWLEHPVDVAQAQGVPQPAGQLAVLARNAGVVTGLALSPDATLVASAALHSDKPVRLFDLNKSIELPGPQIDPATVFHAYAVVFSRDGQFLVAAGEAYRVKSLLDQARWLEPKKIFEGVDASDFDIRVWDVKTMKEVRRFKGHKGCVNGLAVSKDGTLLASAGNDGTACVWEFASGKQTQSYTEQISHFHTVHLTPAGDKLVTGFMGTVWVVDTATGKLLVKFDVERGNVPVGLSPDGRNMVCGAMFRAEFRDLSGKYVGSLPFPPTDGLMNQVRTVAFTPDGGRMLWGEGLRFDHTDPRDKPGGFKDSSCKVRVWNVKSQKELAAFAGHVNMVTSVVMTPDGTRGISGSLDGTVRVWALPK